MSPKANKKSVSKRSKLLIIFGFLFFVNPVPAGLDFIPDVFGCALLFFGLTQLAYFDSSVEEAKKSLLYLFGVEVIHLMLMKSVFLTNIGSNRMLAATAFSVAEGIIYVIFFKKLFSGISYYAMRNDCNETLERCDGTAFLSYLAFFIRIAASLLPELISILELRLNLEVDFETYDAISSLVSAKPIAVVLLSLISFGVSVAWFISVRKTFSLLDKESREKIDAVYAEEYTSHPEKTRPKQLRAATYLVYFAVIFSLDITFDGTRILPASAMFLFLFASAFAFRGLCDFKGVKALAIPAFLLLLTTEIFRAVFTPNGAIVIYATELWVVIVGSLLAIVTAAVMLIAVRRFIGDIKSLSESLGTGEVLTGLMWFCYCVITVLWAIGFAIPYLFPMISSAKLIFSGLFIWQTVKIVGGIYEKERYNYSLYHK
ncbi:MAG: hypothetical protein IKU30_07725 [Clostridia bacterium]|nr:hypothetical protein [Clostridia bacterium]